MVRTAEEPNGSYFSVFTTHASPNYPVRPRQHIRRDRQADLLGGFEVDDEFKLDRLLDGKISRFK